MATAATDVVAAWIDAFNRRDVPGLLELLDPDVEWMPFRAVLEGNVYRGRDGVRKFLSDVEDDIAGSHVDVDEIRDSPDGDVVVLGKIHGRGVASGMDLAVPCAWILRLRGELISYMRAYANQDEALSDAGLA